MKPINIPFNISVLDPKDESLKQMRPVTALDIHDNTGVNFHPDGLFSTLIFGKVGEEARADRHSFINTKAQIFHPAYFKALIGNKRLYMDIVSGKAYALWDAKEKDFVPSDPINGKTGFNFFLTYWKDIRLTPSNSPEKQEAQKLIVNFKHVALTNKVMVLPAAMRDLTVDEDGRTEEDEVNKIYRKLIAVSNTVPGSNTVQDRDVSDAARFKLQMTFNEIHESLESLIDGKRKLVMAKWASRHVVDGTRNVISPLDEAITKLGDPSNIGPNHTVYGLYQAIRACRPVAIFEFKNNFLNTINSGQGTPVYLVNKKTYKSEQVKLKPDDWDKWFSDEGIDKLFTMFQNQEMRHAPVMVGGHFISLIYKGPKGDVRLFKDIDELPPDLNKADVSPVTYAELIYLSVIKRLNKLPLFVTRYPVASLGSIYPSISYIKTTSVDEKRYVLDENWVRTGEMVGSFPIRGEAFINTLCPNLIRIEMLNADFDGDTSSANALYTQESIEEVHDFLAKKLAYVDPSGRLIASGVIATAELVCFNLTR